MEEVTAAVARAAGVVTTTGAAWVAARVAAVTEVMVTVRRGEKAGNRRQIKDWGRATLVCEINRPGSHTRPKRRLCLTP